MTINYRELNEAVIPIHVLYLIISIIVDNLAMRMYHAVLDLANPFFLANIPGVEPQD